MKKKSEIKIVGIITLILSLPLMIFFIYQYNCNNVQADTTALLKLAFLVPIFILALGTIIGIFFLTFGCLEEEKNSGNKS